ncbi:peptide-methionine (S)-S-oxide reductase MsrA [Sphingorhabdus sp.]|uniref:peptide-methionine (S)-S-oxide reductase MsrA n=1 Tax=Sphingorhabdus sp. TaxID=1902408 RepID=UPI003982FE06
MKQRNLNRKRFARLLSVAAILSLATACGSDIVTPIGSAHAAEGIRIAAPATRIVEPKGQQVAIFAGGCFWGVEAVFEGVKGVTRVESGYSGDTKSNADYDLVSAAVTKHAESVRIYYNPAIVSYNDLLHIFFSVAHDPTQLNRQGPDRGKQYRTAIFPANTAQRQAARGYIAQLNKAGYWKNPIVTTIEAFSFFPAETYHQDFMAKNPRHPYIVQWDKPKIANLSRLFPNRVR